MAQSEVILPLGVLWVNKSWFILLLLILLLNACYYFGASNKRPRRVYS